MGITDAPGMGCMADISKEAVAHRDGTSSSQSIRRFWSLLVKTTQRRLLLLYELAIQPG